MPLFQGMQRIRKIIQRGAAEMRKTGLKFMWVTGSKNSNAVRLFRQRNISFQYDHFGRLTADIFHSGNYELKDYLNTNGDEFEICI